LQSSILPSPTPTNHDSQGVSGDGQKIPEESNTRPTTMPTTSTSPQTGGRPSSPPTLQDLRNPGSDDPPGIRNNASFTPFPPAIPAPCFNIMPPQTARSTTIPATPLPSQSTKSTGDCQSSKTTSGTKYRGRCDPLDMVPASRSSRSPSPPQPLSPSSSEKDKREVGPSSSPSTVTYDSASSSSSNKTKENATTTSPTLTSTYTSSDPASSTATSSTAAVMTPTLNRGDHHRHHHHHDPLFGNLQHLPAAGSSSPGAPLGGLKTFDDTTAVTKGRSSNTND
ncbi:hypothetical protein QBC43DRAFT_355073, partial [Cladorrhinum sp. PSN259]